MADLRFVATVPRGFADLLAGEITALGAVAVRESSWRRVIRRLARGGLPRAAGIAPGQPRAAARLRARPWPRPMSLYAFARGIDWREHLDAQRHAGLRIHRQAPGHQQHPLRCAEAEGCDRGPAARHHAPAAFHRDTAARPARARARRQGGRGTADRPGRRCAVAVAATASPVARHHCAKTWRPASCCARAGRASRSEGGEFLDPMCGSGTFAIEAAWMATDTAPGLLRDLLGLPGLARP